MLCDGVFLCAETAETPNFKRFLGKKIHRNSIKITVEFMAERKGFEPLWGCPQTVFKTASL